LFDERCKYHGTEGTASNSKRDRSEKLGSLKTSLNLSVARFPPLS